MPTFLLALVCLAGGLPLATSLGLSLVGRHLPRQGDWLALGGQTVSATGLGYAAWVLWQSPALTPAFTWWQVGDLALTVRLRLDALAGLMLALVAVISLAVQVFSVSYLAAERRTRDGYARYFARLGFFTFAMYGLLLTENLLVIYFFWELVGFASYTLISFWQTREAAVKSARKAFLINRLADLGFLFALMAAWAGAQSLNLSELAGLPAPWLGWAGWGLLLAAMGKSAQGLLAGWLPDAMEGPTPVSALLHAATMVAAGVYLLARAYFLLPPSAQWLALAVGGATVVWAGLAATQQSDLKKVLAYSTVSQLGYMFLALGAGAPALALFHLFTHAFFKAVLFLSAGSVIHYVGEELRLQQSPRSPQQMANLGGLARRLPWVFVCYTLAALALAGLPFLAGFLSKELILNQLLALARGQAGGWAQGLAGFGLLAGVTGAALTAFYLAKQWWLVFVSPARWLPPPQAVAGEGHVSAWERWPLLGLSLFVPFFAFSAHPWHPEAAWLLPPLLGDGVLPPASGWLAWLTLAFTALGLGLAGWRYGGRANRSLGPGPHFGWAWLNRFTDQWLPGAGLFGSRQLARWDQRVVDGLVNYVGVAVVVAGHCSAWWDRHVVDGLVRLVARLTAQAGQLARQPQASGQVQQYYGWAVGALVAMVLGLAWWLG